MPFINRTLDNKPIRELLLEYKADVVEGIEDATDEVGAGEGRNGRGRRGATDGVGGVGCNGRGWRGGV